MFYMRYTPRYNALGGVAFSWELQRNYIRLVYLCVCVGNYRGYLLDLSVKFTYAFKDASALHRHHFLYIWGEAHL